MGKSESEKDTALLRKQQFLIHQQLRRHSVISQRATQFAPLLQFAIMTSIVKQTKRYPKYQRA